MCDEENLNALILDKNFQKLHRQLSRFNIFNATSMSDWEIRHTRFLGFLLDPNECHGLKEEFLFRFLQLASLESGGGIPLLDFNLSYAQVFKEKFISKGKVMSKGEVASKKESSRIDLLIEIPSLADPKVTYIVVIENKIKSGQGKRQLERYKKVIDAQYCGESFKNYYLYLTVFDEAPEDDGWHSINYSNNILSAIQGILEDFRDTTSEYMKSVLGDYMELISSIQDDESYLALDKVAESIPVDMLRTAQGLANNGGAESFTARLLKTRYRKVLDFLRDYDGDIRAGMFRNFLAKKDLPLGLRIESSNRTYLRLSFLNEDVGKMLESVCRNPTQQWLQSGRHLAFELILRKKKDNNINCRVNLVLGPTGVDYIGRDDLVMAIRRVIPGAPNNRFSAQFTTIHRGGFVCYNKTVRNSDEGIKWVDETIKSLSQKSLIPDINVALGNFFSEQRQFAPEGGAAQ